MKRRGWLVTALLLVCCGCAQSGKNPPSMASRLQNLETSFAQFQEQERTAETERRSRDADIDNKLRDISTRLGISAPGQPQSGASRIASAPATGTAKSPRSLGGRPMQPVVAGQVVPFSQVSSSVQPPVVAPAQPEQTKSVPPASAAPAGNAVAPVNPSIPVSPAAVVPSAAPPSALSAIRPPVVTLGLDTSPVQSASPVSPRAPTPLAGIPKRGHTSQELYTPKTVEAAPVQAASPGLTPVLPGVPASALTPVTPGASAPVPAPAAPVAPASGAASRLSEEEGKAYVDAMRAVTANKNEEGRRKLNDFMVKYPDSAKTPEAQFWIGESYMNEKGYNQAILAFKEVVTRFPKDPKAAESYFRVGDAYEKLGDKSNAASNLKMLVEQHPTSEWAGKAKLKLKQLGQ